VLHGAGQLFSKRWPNFRQAGHQPADVPGGVEHGSEQREVVGDRLLVEVSPLHDELVEVQDADLVEHERPERWAQVAAGEQEIQRHSRSRERLP